MELDRYDVQILRELTQTGRLSWRDLAERIGLSLTPTLRRVRRLEDKGYIKGYSANVDERRLAGAMIVFISVTLERQIEGALAVFEQEVSKQPEVMSGFLMTGGADYLLRAVVHDLDHYQELVSKLTRIPGVAQIHSSFALKSFINRPAPIFPKDH
jgi:Lrp/AsnC family transcriptional regulator, leucine-responsive regulatory protein